MADLDPWLERAASVTSTVRKTIDDGKPETFTLRQLTADGQVVEHILTQNIVLTPRMLFESRAIGPFVSLFDHLSSPPVPDLLRDHLRRGGHFIPGLSTILALIGFLGPILVVLAPGAPLFEEEGRPRRQALSVDFVDPVLTDRTGGFAALAADNSPMDASKIARAKLFILDDWGPQALTAEPPPPRSSR